jgi:hypothetical protein
MPVYSAWPADSYQLYHEIKANQAAIYEMSTLCLEEGRRFKEVIEVLTPIIRTRAGEIVIYAGQIIEMKASGQAGRYPKWFKICEQVEELAGNIGLIVSEEITPALRVNNMTIVWAMLEEIKRQAAQIEKTLKQIPRPMKPAGLESWEEAADIVNEKLK